MTPADRILQEPFLGHWPGREMKVIGLLDRDGDGEAPEGDGETAI